MRRFFLSLLITICLALPTFATEITTMDTKFVMGEDGAVTANCQMLVLISEGESTLSFPIGQGQNAQIIGQNPKVTTTEDGRYLTLNFEPGGHRSQEFTMTYQVNEPISPSGDGLLLTLPILPEGSPYPIGTFTFSVELPNAVETAPVYVGGYYSEIADNYFNLKQTSKSFSGKSLESLRDHDDLTATLQLPGDYILYNGDEGMAWWLCAFFLVVLGALGVLFWDSKLRSRGTPRRSNQLPKGVGPGDFGWMLSNQAPSLPLELTHWASRGLAQFHLEGRHVLRVSQHGLVGTNSAPIKRKTFDRIFGQQGEFYQNFPQYRREVGKYEDNMARYWQRETMAKDSGNPGILGLLVALSWAVILAYGAGQSLGSFTWRDAALWLFALSGLVLCLLSKGLVKAILDKRTVLMTIKSVALLGFVGTAFYLGGPLPALCGLVYYSLWQWCSYRGGKRSRHGQELHSHCRGFARSLKAMDSHTLQEKCKADPNYFYQTLPFAHALGYGEKFVQKMGKTPLPPCPWLLSNGKKARSAKQFYAQYLLVLRLLSINS